MELWQMDVVGGFHLADGIELKAVSGIDDSSRFGVSAKLVRRATAGPVCEALLTALRRHGVPDQIFTDIQGKVFTGRFGPAGSSAEVLFDRVCAENGIRRPLTAPRSPTTTGKVERWHKTIRAELAEHDYRHATIADLQAALDGWVVHYNTERPHQALGMRPPDREVPACCRARRGDRRRTQCRRLCLSVQGGGGAVR
jgi:transposase InsO family protein